MTSRKRKNCGCLLIHDPGENEGIQIMSMGLLAIAQKLEREDFKTKILHLGVERLNNKNFSIKQVLKSRDYKLIGISAHWFPQLGSSLKLAKEIKKFNKELFIVFGGYTSSYFAKEIVENFTFVDAVIRGEGEYPLLKLMEKIYIDDKDLESVPNLVWRQGSNMMINTFSYVADKEDLNGLEFANMNLLGNYKRYQDIFSFIPLKKASFIPLKKASFIPPKKEHFDSGKTFYLCIGRGCSQNCLSCGGSNSSQRIINNRSGIVYRSPETVISTIKKAQDFGYQNFDICFDPHRNRDYYLKLFELVRREKLSIGLYFSCWSLPTKNFVDEFSRTFSHGLIEISPETWSENIRRINKGFFYTNKELEEMIEYIGKKGLPIHLYFSYFLAHDSEEDVEKTRMYFWKLLNTYGEFLSIYYLSLSTDPGSLIHQQAEIYGLKLEASSLTEYLSQAKIRNFGVMNLRSNLLLHYPMSMSKERAKFLSFKVNLDRILNTIFSFSLRGLYIALKSERKLVNFLDSFYSQVPLNASLDDMISLFPSYVNNYLPIREYLCDLLEYELANYKSRESPPTVRHTKDWRNENFLDVKPILSNNVLIKEFRYNINDIIDFIKRGNLPENIPKTATTILSYIYKTEKKILIINNPMKRLIEISNGKHSVSQIIDRMVEYHSSSKVSEGCIRSDIESCLRMLLEREIYVVPCDNHIWCRVLLFFKSSRRMY